MKSVSRCGIGLAILAAALYAVNSPFSKLLLERVPATLMAGLLYIGAGAGMVVIALIRRCRAAAKDKSTSDPCRRSAETGKANEIEPGSAGGAVEQKLTRRDLPYTIAMIVLDIAAPIFLMMGLSRTSAASASLLNNFEIVATALIALLVFREKIPAKLWIGILFVTLSCCLLSFDGTGRLFSRDTLNSLHFSVGSLFVLLAACCWGLENNCTRKLSAKDPLEIVLLKGVFSGTGSLVIGLCLGERIAVSFLWCIPLVLILGFVAYGLSIYFYVHAQRLLGAARTSAYYAVAPFIGALLSLAIFREVPGVLYFVALAFMLVGAFLSA